MENTAISPPPSTRLRVSSIYINGTTIKYSSFNYKLKTITFVEFIFISISNRKTGTFMHLLNNVNIIRCFNR